MKYNELININENFQYSVNLQFDINNISKIKDYILTKDGCEILKIYFNSIINNKNRSTTLIGPYGKGKSHLLLILITLLNNYNKEDNKDINEFINKIKLVDKELYDIVIEIRKSKIRLMPIIINSNYNDLNQAFLLALSEALERENINNLVINTYFDIALNVIENWETNYKDVIKNVNECLNDYDINLKELKQGLKKYSMKHYKIFKNVYSCILHGQVFNPLINADIIKIYKDITYQINEYGYNGIYIVFDEFSKFLESVDNTRMMKDLKILQDFAELASRTSKQEQIHLNCITHKTINEYLKNFSVDKVNAFKTVEGRFKEIYFNRSLEQNYEIVSHALKKNETFDKYYEKYYQKEINFYSDLEQLSIFKNIDNVKEILFKGCFPLNPITVYSLINLSEKIAQNERTLFTFLTDDDNNSLKKFINNNDNNLFSIDKIYDYFKNIFKKETDEHIKNIYIKTENALYKINNEIEKMIIKALSIIYMINDLDNFIPDDNTIKLAINITNEEYEIAINNLFEKSILKRKKITNDIDFATIYNKELTKEINYLTETKFKNINELETLNKIINNGYSIPRRYNDNYKITRFFKNIFMTEEEILNLNNFKLILEDNYCDGIVINLLKTSRNIQKLKEHFQNINDQKVVLKLSKSILSKTFLNLLKEYEAIDYLKNTSYKTEEISNELELMKIEINDTIKEAIDLYFSKDNIQEYWYCQETKKKVSNISSFLSDICEKVYYKTPIINNELINKKDLTSPIKKARSIVIDTVLLNDLSLISSPTSSEATIYNAIVKKKDNNSIKEVLNIIQDFIQKSDNNKIPFSKLYNILEKEPYAIRKGIIPILLSIVLYNYSDNIIIYFINKEIDLDSNNLIKINDNPEKYYILTEKGTTDKIKYLSSLLEIYQIPNIDNTRVNLKKLIDTMKKWILSLPRILREMNHPIDNIDIKEEYLIIKSELLKPDINNNEFIYKRLLEIFNTNDYNHISLEIKNMKEKFDNFINDYSNILIEDTKNILSKSFKGSLTSSLKEWYNKNNLANSKTIYDYKTKEFINYVANLTSHDSYDIIEKISKIVTNYYIEDSKIDEYNNYLEELSNIINNIKNSKQKKEETAKKIVLINGNEIIEKNISKNADISPLGNTMKNNIEEIIEEYGASIDEQEKINILLDIMKNYL